MIVAAYYRRTLSTYELMFVKVSRELLTKVYRSYLTYTTLVISDYLIGKWGEHDDFAHRLQQELIKRHIINNVCNPLENKFC